MSKIKYPDDIIRARRQSIEVAENLEIWSSGDEFILELFKSGRSVYEELADALDEAASLILGDGPVDSVEFIQADGVWSADMNSLRASLYVRSKK
nr:MAG TPA: hypothetical protein [Caudoviricetes sp.]